MILLGRIRKAIATLVGAIILWFDVVIASHNGSFPVGDITAYEWLALGIAVATALGVYGISNDTKPVPPEIVPINPSVSPPTDV